MLPPNIIHYPGRLALLGFGIWRLALVEGAATLITEVVTTPCSTDPAVTPIGLPSGMLASASLGHGSIVVHSADTVVHSTGAAIPSAGTVVSLASTRLATPSAVSGSIAPSVMNSMDLASLCLAYSGRTPLSPLATGFVTANGTSANNSLLSGNSALLSSDTPAPDWTVSTDDLAPPPTIPEPKPHSVSDPTTAQLIRTVQDKILRNYEAYSTFSCFNSGSTLHCSGPWLYASQWDNSSLSERTFPNTASHSSYSCASDSSYLQSSKYDRNFYGFTAANLTDSLQSMANYTALWAAGACTSNSSCAAAYQNNTEQMYSDFRGYIESGFFDFMNAALQNSSLSYCPRRVSDISSLVTYATSHFDGGREYYGLHNPIFVDGVAQLINGTEQEARFELGLSMANNAKRAEAVFLNMIFFAPHSTMTKTKRAADDEEVYPGCPRKDYVLNGGCEGVLPPREYDLAGDFMSMKDRDQLEVWRSTTHKLENTGLVLRDTDCDARQSRIASTIKDIQIARDVLGTTLGVLASAELIILGIEVGGPVVVVGGPVAMVLYGLALPELLMLMTFAECQPFKTCDGIPPAAIDVANALGKFQAGLASKYLTNKAGIKNLVGLLRRVVSEGNLGALAKFENLAAGGAGALVGIGGTIVDKLLNNAQKYYEGALGCCQSSNCASATCVQASVFCLLSFGNQWSGSGGLRCDKT